MKFWNMCFNANEELTVRFIILRFKRGVAIGRSVQESDNLRKFENCLACVSAPHYQSWSPTDRSGMPEANRTDVRCAFLQTLETGWQVKYRVNLVFGTFARIFGACIRPGIFLFSPSHHLELIQTFTAK